MSKIKFPPPPPGQMSDHEREVLRDQIHKIRPEVVAEGGCWFGGGSTFQIAAALRENGYGRLHTCDTNPEHSAVAAAYYHQPFWADAVKVHTKPFFALFMELMASGPPPAFVMFDGGENPQENLDDFLYIESKITPYTVFCMHDWLNPESHKADLVRPYLERSRRWGIYCLLEPPLSVGLVFARFYE